MITLAPNQQRAKTTIILFKTMLVMSLVIVAANLVRLSGFNSDISEELQQAIYLMSQGLLIVARELVHLVTAIFFIMWFRRAYNNLHKIDSSVLSHSEGWAAGGWFVPIISFFYPYQIMKEIWRHTQRHISDSREIRNTSLIGLWWTFFLISNIGGSIAQRIADSTSDPEEQLSYTAFSVILDLPGLLLAIKLVKTISGFETELYNSYVDRQFLQANPPAIPTEAEAQLTQDAEGRPQQDVM